MPSSVGQRADLAFTARSPRHAATQGERDIGHAREARLVAEEDEPDERVADIPAGHDLHAPERRAYAALEQRAHDHAAAAGGVDAVARGVRVGGTVADEHARATL